MDNQYEVVRMGELCESQYGMRTVEKIKAERLGNYALLAAGPWTG